MPLIPVIAGVVGLGGGFILGKGTEGVGDIIKWGVLGFGGYIAAKHYKVI